MARSSPPSSPWLMGRRGRSRSIAIAALSASLVAAFAVASLAGLRLKNRMFSYEPATLRRSVLSRGENIGHTSWNVVNGTAHRRALQESVLGLDNKHLQSARFRLRSGFNPAAHPSQPYLVMIDEETGAFVQTVEYGHEGHPLSQLADLREPRGVAKESIFFFVVPMASGGRMKTIMTNCYELRRSEKREDPESLELVGGVVNVDTQTLRGLAKARSSNIVDSGAIDVYATSYFLEGMMLFKPEHKGRAFTILRHPVLRAESLYQSHGSHERGFGLLEYLESPEYIDNWIVRSLTNEKTGTLSEDHLLVAKGILASKFFVGISEYLQETIKRLEIYYGWGQSKKKGCVNNYLAHELEKEEESIIQRGSYEWKVITAKDKYDLMLYYYALELFAKQGTTMFDRPYVDKSGKKIDFAELKRKKMLEEQILSMMGGA